MEALRFILKGKTAFFKNPEVNSYYYFSYGNIHKPVLLGMFGAILGYKGYEQGICKGQKSVYPEYYERLKELKISIIPGKEDGHFYKKMQSYNNSVGYASKEQGGNLIVKEQWIEDPEWTIYIQMNDEESAKLADAILDHRCVYMPNLGTNDHPAQLLNESIVSLEEIDAKEKKLHSLGVAQTLDFDWDVYFNYKYEEYLPIALKESTNHYCLEKFVLTDTGLLEASVPVYTDGVKNIVFY